MIVSKLSSDAILPVKATSGSAGFDLFSACDDIIEPGRRKLIYTDISITLPEGCYGRIAPRSGLSLKYEIDIGAGVIDSDYTGNVGIILINNGMQPFAVNKGDRVAQLILEKYYKTDTVYESIILPVATERGENGFGSTGTN